ncbi:hypothetical protein MKX01_028951, partial [Papaver californicum]
HCGLDEVLEQLDIRTVAPSPFEEVESFFTQYGKEVNKFQDLENELNFHGYAGIWKVHFVFLIPYSNPVLLQMHGSDLFPSSHGSFYSQ